MSDVSRVCYFGKVIHEGGLGRSWTVGEVYFHPQMTGEELTKADSTVTTSPVQSITRHNESGILALVTEHVTYLQRLGSCDIESAWD